MSGRAGSMVKRRLLVLYVEDSKTEAQALANEIGYAAEVDVVTTIVEAIARLAANTYDAILLDLTLPDAQGLEGLKTLRACTTVPIIVLTGADDPNDELAQRAIEAGASHWIEKPARGRHLVLTIKLELARQHLESCAHAGG